RGAERPRRSTDQVVRYGEYLLIRHHRTYRVPSRFGKRQLSASSAACHMDKRPNSIGFHGRTTDKAWTLQPKNGFSVLMKEFFEHVIGIADLHPFLDETLVGEAGIVAAEHHLVLEAPADVALDRLRNVFDAPSRHLPVHITLVKTDGGGLVDPRVAGVRHHDLQSWEIRGDLVDGKRVSVSKLETVTTRHLTTHAGHADIDANWHVEILNGVPQRIERA